MKKIFLLIFILISLGSAAQDWAWIFGQYNDTAPDSVTAVEIRRIRTEIKTANPASYTTNVTVDSIKGSFAMAFYRMVKRANAGEIAPRYTAITSAIEAVPVMATFTAAYNATMLSEFNLKRNRGKTIVMDN